MAKTLPSRPDIAWLKKASKERLAELRTRDAAAKLHQAQLEIARDYGFPSWRALKAHVDALSLDGQIIAAAVEGRAEDLDRLLLHLAAEAGRLDCVEVLLRRGFDINRRDRFDRATALHWAAYEGRLAVVKRLLDTGADIDGEGDE